MRPKRGSQLAKKRQMAELYPIEDVLETLAGFSGIQRVLLSTTGTLQTALSAYFGSVVNVRVVQQNKQDDTNQYFRSVEMFFESMPDLVICHASSKIICEKSKYAAEIEKGDLGIGQIMPSTLFGLYSISTMSKCVLTSTNSLVGTP